MSRGGYRPGAGRKKGQKDSKPRKGTPAHAEAEKIRQMLAMGIKAKARFYQEFLVRVSKGEKLSLAEKKMMNQLATELSAETEGKKPEAPPENISPLTYMLQVLNDPKADLELRARMAIAAAPFVHPRKGEGAGKKNEKADRAERAGSGKFAPSKPPLKLVGREVK